MTGSTVTNTPAAPLGGVGAIVTRLLPKVVLAGAVAYTVAILLDPRAMTSWYSPDARILIEALSVAVALFAALALAIPADDVSDASRNAFIAALLSLAASYTVVIVGFILFVSPSRTGQVMGVYAWLCARYLAGMFFIIAAVGRPKLSVRQYVGVIVVVMAATIAACGLLRDVLPTPVTSSVRGLAVVTFSPLEHTLISLVPAGLFGVGAVLAWRLRRRRRRSIYGWIAFALLVQTLSKIHESVYAATFGPVITSSDLLRIATLVLLLAGAVLAVRDLGEERAAAMEAQQRDLVALETMYGSLARFAEKEQVFRGIVAHELATPVAAIRAFAHVLANADADAERAAASGGIADAARRLQELIERIEELRDIENDDFAVDVRTTPVRSIIDDAAAFLRVLPGQHRVVVDSDDIKVIADPLRLSQALRNLGTNAVRYSPPGSVIVLSARRVGNDHAHLAVIDSGPGISPSDRHRLVEKYQRGARSGKTPGAGLGLYVAERIATAHGGRLLFHDGPDGRGTSAIIEVRSSS